VAASKKGEPAYAVLSSAAGGPDGKPMLAVLEVSDPILSKDEHTLTMDAKFVPADSKAHPVGGGVAAALARPPAGGAAPASFAADTVSLAVDNPAPAPPPSAAPGDKSIIGAAVGAGIGDALCGTLCGMGGAASGASNGYGYGYQPVVYYG
jgi:hypothetical protein